VEIVRQKITIKLLHSMPTDQIMAAALSAAASAFRADIVALPQEIAAGAIEK
jgi:hypothetical protein